MKTIRIITMIIISAFLLLNMPVTLAFADSDDDESSVLVKADFDSGSFEGWSAFGSHSVLSLDQVHSHSGNSSLRASERTAAWSGPALNITKYVSGGDLISFDAFVLGVGNVTQADISMSLKITDMNGNDEYVTIDTISYSNGIWKRIRGTLEIPRNTIDIVLYVESDTTDLDIYVDDVIVSIAGKAPEPTEHVRSENDPEYVFDFENSTEGWIPRGDVSISLNTNFAYTGKNSLYASNRQKTWNAPRVRMDKVIPGRSYTYTAFVMYNGREYEDSHVFHIELQYSVEGSEVYVPIAGKLLQKGTWSKLSGAYTVPENADDIYLYIQTEYVPDEEMTVNDIMSFYVDNVTVIDSSIIARNELQKTMTRLLTGTAIVAVIALITVLIILKRRDTKHALRNASLDLMTHAYNRNAFEDEVGEYQRAPEKLIGKYVTACDVNFLKYINDNYGHESGDRAIIRCASVLSRSIGKKGKVFRTGGDEFICITSDDPLSRIRSEFMLEAGTYCGYPFSIAVGTTTFTPKHKDDQPDIMKLLNECDQAMYKDKQRIKAEFAEFSGMKSEK